MRFSLRILPYLLFFLAVLLSLSSAAKLGDFDVFLDAATKMKTKENFYVIPSINGLQYFYSVFFAMILSPFVNYPVFIKSIWLISSLLMLWRSFSIGKAYLQELKLSAKKLTIWSYLLLFLAIQFILYNISMVQVTLFLLWGMLEAFNLLQKNREISAGLILATLINIKIMPVLLLPYLFYRGYFKAIAAIIVGFIILLYLPGVFIGWKYNQFLMQEWWLVINPLNKEHMFESGIGSHSIVALIPVYLTDTVGEMDVKRNFLNLAPKTVELIINLSRVLLLGISILFLRWPFFKRPTFQPQLIWEFAYFLLIIPVLMPHMQKYNFLLVLPMIACILYFWMVKENYSTKDKVILSSFVVLMLVFSPLYGRDILGKYLFDLTQHFRLLTIVTLLLIPIGLYCNPNKLKHLQKAQQPTP